MRATLGQGRRRRRAVERRVTGAVGRLGGGVDPAGVTGLSLGESADSAADAAPSPQPGIDNEAADPVAVEVPAIGVNAPVVPLGLEPSGALEVPQDARQTGWWTGGPEPGERGPAVVAGHVDSRAGPAVFYRLRELRPGDPITVRRADGSRVQFAVQRSEQHPKAAFPTDSVYTPTTGAELRLITCGGSFDRSSGHYVDNVIVYERDRPGR
jgi:sortase (surface protein transpeptidase)